MSKHIVIYMGNGVWKDNKGELWGVHPTNKDIQKSRSFDTDQSKEQFLEDRGDIGFMVRYGQMMIETADTTQPVEEVLVEEAPVEEAPVEPVKVEIKPAPVQINITPSK